MSRRWRTCKRRRQWSREHTGGGDANGLDVVDAFRDDFPLTLGGVGVRVRLGERLGKCVLSAQCLVLSA